MIRQLYLQQLERSLRFDAEYNQKRALPSNVKIPDKILTPVEVQGFLLSHRDDMLGALTQCDSWVADMLNAKQRKSNIIKLDPVPGEAHSNGKKMNGKKRPASVSKPLPGSSFPSPSIPGQSIFSMMEATNSMGGRMPSSGPMPMGGPYPAVPKDDEDEDEDEDEEEEESNEESNEEDVQDESPVDEEPSPDLPKGGGESGAVILE